MLSQASLGCLLGAVSAYLCAATDSQSRHADASVYTEQRCMPRSAFLYCESEATHAGSL